MSNLAAELPDGGNRLEGEIDKLCEEFDREWVNHEKAPSLGQEPSIKSYLQRVPKLRQGHLFQALLPYELDHRWKRCGKGKSALPTTTEYCRRFSCHEKAVDTVFKEYARSGSHGIWHYLIEEIAATHLSSVYRGFDTVGVGQIVAVKVVCPDLASSPQDAARFEQEWRTTIRLNGDGIVPVISFGKYAGGRQFILMKWMEGGSLEKRLRAGRLPVLDCVRIMIAVARAHSWAETKGIIHRDLKPSNILFDESDRPHIADYGLAIHEGDQWHHRAEMAGTIEYMAPEQLRATSEGLDRCDIWAMGVILYEMLTGTRPYRVPRGVGEAERVAALLKLQEKPPRSIRQRVDDPTIDQAVEDFCSKCLAYDPNDRFPSAAALADTLQDWLESQPSHGRAVDERVLLFPYRANEFFVGREVCLRQIAQALAKGKPAALHGMPAVGKTRLAIEYVAAHQSEYRYVLWLDAGSRETLASSFSQAARKLRLPLDESWTDQRIAGALRQWLGSRDGWLLVCDNADDLSQIRSLVAASRAGHMLVTTQERPDPEEYAPIPVPVMDEGDATTLLLSRAGLVDPGQPLDGLPPHYLQAAKDLVSELGGLPLALEQAGVSMREEHTTPAEYLKQYREHGSELRRGPDDPGAGHLAVSITFSLAFKALEGRSKAASDLLRLCALLAPAAIPEDIFPNQAAAKSPELGAVSSNERQFRKVFAVARRWSLIERNSDDASIKLHRLVQQVRRELMSPREAEAWLVCVARIMCHIVPLSTFSTWAKCERLLPHVVEVAMHLIASTSGDPAGSRRTRGQGKSAAGAAVSSVGNKREAASFLLSRAGLYLSNRGKKEAAEKCFRLALEYASKKTRPGAVLLLARFLRYRGTFDEAEALLNTLSEKRTVAGAVLMELAHLQFYKDDYQTAQQTVERLLAGLNSGNAEDEKGSIVAKCLLAHIHVARDRRSEAIATIQDIAERAKKLYGAAEHDFGLCLFEVAQLNELLGRLADAESAYLQSIDILQRTGDPQIAIARLSLALLYSTQRRIPEARAALEPAAAFLGGPVAELLGLGIPDAPCPCGSGSKFTECCMKKRRSE